MSDEAARRSQDGGPPQSTDPAFGFFFGALGQAIEADTLEDALQGALDLSADDLQEVWCLRSCNLIWASEGYYHTGPWKDPEPANAE